MSIAGNKKPRWLFLGKRFYTSKDALEERFGRIYQLPLHWSRNGIDVRLWLVDYHTRNEREVHDEQLRITSTPALSLRGLGFFASILMRARPEVIVASGDCYIGLLGWLLARLCGSRFVFDIYDKYDEFDGYRRPLGWDLFGFLRRRADRRFYAATSLAEYFKDMPSGKSSVVPNGVDYQQFRTMDRDECRHRLGLDRSLQFVGYFGSLEPERGVQDLLAALRHIRAHNDKLHVLICGKAHPNIDLQGAGIVYRGMVPHWQIPFYLNACDVLVIPYRRALLVDTSSSCKIAEYFSCRRPIVSTFTPNFTENFPEQAAMMGSALCNPGDVLDLVRALQYQFDNAVVSEPIPGMDWGSIAQAALNSICGVAYSARP